MKIAAALMLALALGACRGEPTVVATPTPTETVSLAPCVPDADESSTITAQDNAFDKSCLGAIAEKAFTITLVNADEGQAHSVSVYSRHPEQEGADLLFQGGIFAGVETKEYRVQPLAAGVYHFHCEVHASTMFGSLVVTEET